MPPKPLVGFSLLTPVSISWQPLHTVRHGRQPLEGCNQTQLSNLNNWGKRLQTTFLHLLLSVVSNIHWRGGGDRNVFPEDTRVHLKNHATKQLKHFQNNSKETPTTPSSMQYIKRAVLISKGFLHYPLVSFMLLNNADRQRQCNDSKENLTKLVGCSSFSLGMCSPSWILIAASESV